MRPSPALNPHLPVPYGVDHDYHQRVLDSLPIAVGILTIPSLSNALPTFSWHTHSDRNFAIHDLWNLHGKTVRYGTSDYATLFALLRECEAYGSLLPTISFATVYVITVTY